MSIEAEPTNPHVQTIIDMAKLQRLAVIYYRKGVTSEQLRPRLIEPYHFVDGRQDLMIRAFQLEHGGDAGECGWKFFMVGRIDGADPTGVQFTPRRKISLPNITSSTSVDPHWANVGRREYRDVIGTCLADGGLLRDELEHIERIKRIYELSEDDVRFVHAHLYHRCLGAVLDDGFLEEDEVEQIRFLHKSLSRMGWCVGD